MDGSDRNVPFFRQSGSTAQIHFLTNPTRCSWLCFLKLWRRNLLFFYLCAGCIFDDWHILSISPSICDSSWGDVKALHPLVDPLPLTLPPTSSPFHRILTHSYVLSLNPPPHYICQATLREKQLHVGVGSMGLESDKPGLGFWLQPSLTMNLWACYTICPCHDVLMCPVFVQHTQFAMMFCN